MAFRLNLFAPGAMAAVVILSSLSAESVDMAKLVATIPLPRVEGRIDHLSIDVAGDRLFVAALGNDTVEVVDLKNRRVTHSLPGFSEPQGLAFVPEFNRLYVANGGDGSLRVLDGRSFQEIARLNFDDDADNVRYDPAAKLLYVGHGGGGLGMVDVAKDVVVGDIPLSAHPESFQLERNGSRLFVNVPRSHTVAVVDRTTRKAVGQWSLGAVAANFPLALDEAHHRAFIACRLPARLLVFDTESGKELAKLALHGDCDDVFYDGASELVYASCGEGFLDIFSATNAGDLAPKGTVATAAGARTAFFDGRLLYIAAPKRGSADAKILIYEIGP